MNVNILKKLFLIYNLKPFNEKGNTFFINYKNDIYVFFRNFMFLGTISSLDFFYSYLEFVKTKVVSNILIYQLFFLIVGFFENFDFNKICCLRKTVKFN